MSAKRKAAGADHAKPKHQKQDKHKDEPAPVKAADVSVAAEKQKVAEAKPDPAPYYFTVYLFMVGKEDDKVTGWKIIPISHTNPLNSERDVLREEIRNTLANTYVVSDGILMTQTVTHIVEHGQINPQTESTPLQTIFDITILRWQMQQGEPRGVVIKTIREILTIMGSTPNYHGTIEFRSKLEAMIPKGWNTMVTHITATPVK